MKSFPLAGMICLVFIVLMAGCTSQPVSPPETTTPPAVGTPAMTAMVPVAVADAGLVGTWTLTEMGIQGGQAVLNVFSAPITITFFDQGTLAGNGGCNNYNAPYTLTGETDPFGKEIMIGPITSTQMYCLSTSDTETTYFQILQKVSSYSIEGGQTLSMRDENANVLVFSKG
jgi:heat shock protein HslJ